MNTQEFCYWLQGFFELCPDCSTLNEKQVQAIRNHLNLVFVHDIDPRASEGKELPEQYEELLQDLHDGKLQRPPSKPNQGPQGPVYRC